ncbi:hypothetical protein, partial [Verrucomicrobium spinosum]|uniref:hypothetical protein n=1 Tax=Verrucomicrobium spinosum TaxID=2736 RepID=UPI001C449A17
AVALQTQDIRPLVQKKNTQRSLRFAPPVAPKISGGTSTNPLRKLQLVAIEKSWRIRPVFPCSYLWKRR